MKTIKIYLKTVLCALVFLILLSTNLGCAAFFDAELGTKPIPIKDDGTPDFDKIEDMILEDFRKNNQNFYPQNFLEFSGGLGLNSVEDQSETSYCIGAGYNYRISEDNYNRASYIKGFATQHWQDSDNLKSSITRVGAGYTLFDRIDKLGQLDLTYGVDINYGFGTFENFNVDEDYTELAASLKIGANYQVTDKFSVGITAPVFSWTKQTFEANGFEFEQENTWVGLNKNNLVMAYGRINLD